MRSFSRGRIAVEVSVLASATVAAVVAGSVFAGGAEGATSTVRVSLTASGGQPDDWSDGGSVSSDGHLVAFNSHAASLVGGDTNGVGDVFVKDLTTGAVARVSVSSSGAQANAASVLASMTPDGRYVVFTSDASNLVSADTNVRQDVFIRDRVAGITERIGDDSSSPDLTRNPSISADGRYVAYEQRNQIWVRDRQAGQTRAVSAPAPGATAPSPGSGQHPSITADGAAVIFTSWDPLVPGDTNGTYDVFKRDLSAGVTTRVSVTATGGQAEPWENSEGGVLGSDFGVVSGDGRYVSFTSVAANLVAGDTEGTEDLFVKDLQTGALQVARDGNLGEDSYNSFPSISADGRYVAYGTYDPAAGTGGSGAWVVLAWDRVAGTTQAISTGLTGHPNGDSTRYQISADGRFVIFSSYAANLVTGDTNNRSDVFLTTR